MSAPGWYPYWHQPTYTIQYVATEDFDQKVSRDEDMDPCKARKKNKLYFLGNL